MSPNSGYTPESHGLKSDDLPWSSDLLLDGYQELGWGWYADICCVNIDIVLTKEYVYVKKDVWDLIDRWTEDEIGFTDMTLNEFMIKIFGPRESK